MRPTTVPVLALLLVAGTLVRALYLVPPIMDSDQAVFGLQARHILLGEFPVFSWGYAYVGTLQSYLAALAFALFGASRLVLDAVPLLPALGFILVTGAIGRELGGVRVGLAAAALVAVAPPYLALHGAWARHGYMDTLCLGSVVLLLALRLSRPARAPAAEARDFAVLGLVGGLAWWTNGLSVYYLAPAALFLLVHRWRAIGRRGPWLAAGLFGLGSAPFWLWNATHRFQSFRLFKGSEAGSAPVQLWRVVGEGIPAILGARGSHARQSFLPGLSEAVVVLYAIALVFLVGRLVLAWRRAGGARGADLLCLFLACAALLLSASRYGETVTAEGTKRYLLPLYSALPVIYALFAAALALPLALHLYGNLASYPIVTGELAAFRQARAADVALFGFLKSRGLTRVYVPDYWLAPRLAFDAAEEIVFAQPVGDRHPEYTRLVDASARVAYLFGAGGAGGFDAYLRAIGAAFERSPVGPYEVYHDFRAPGGVETLRSLSTREWRAAASAAGTTTDAALDRDVDTSWYSGEPLRPGLFFEVDLGRPAAVGKVVALSPRPSIGRPRGFRVDVSADGRHWAPTAAVPPTGFSLDWMGGQPRLGPGARLVSAFAPREVRYVRIEQTGSDPRWWWAIAEVFVYGVAGEDGAAAAAAAGAATWHLERAATEEARGRLGGAIGEAWRAARLAPELEAAHLRLAALYERAGVPVEGAVTPAVRAALFEKLGLWSKAAGEYEKAIRRGADGADPAALRRRLEEVTRRAGAEPSAMSAR